jgi:glutathionylspermidine synthase
LSLVDVVAQEQIVEGMDISCVERSLPDVEESHEVNVLSMDVSYNFDWWPDLLDDDGLGSQNLSALIGQLNNVLSLAWKLSSWLNLLALLWLQERFQKHLAK